MTKHRPSRETFGERMTTHGHARDGQRSITYGSWVAMINRCTNPRQPQYPRYGGRGIKICARWRNSFAAFLEDMGERPTSRHSLDRWPDNDGDYQPGNCRWATMTEQCRNRSTTRPVIRSDGKRFESMVEAAEAIGGNRTCIRDACTGRQKTHLGYQWRFAK